MWPVEDQGEDWRHLDVAIGLGMRSEHAVLGTDHCAEDGPFVDEADWFVFG